MVKYSKDQKIFIFSGIVLLIIGIGFLIAGFFFTNQLIKSQNEYDEVLATVIISDKNSETTFINYEYKGVNYLFSINYYSSGNNTGDLLITYVNPHNPTQLVIKQELFILQLVMYLTGSVILLSGLIIVLYQIKQNKKYNYLINNGSKVRAIVTSEVINTYYAVNNRHPYNLYAEYNSHRFKSKNYWNSIKKDGIKQTVNVYHEDYKKYYVDLTSIKELIDLDEDLFKIDENNY